MGLLAELGSRLRAILIILALFGVVVVDAASRIISTFADGFLAIVILVLIWPLIKSKPSAEKQ